MPSEQPTTKAALEAPAVALCSLSPVRALLAEKHHVRVGVSWLPAGAGSVRMRLEGTGRWVVLSPQQKPRDRAGCPRPRRTGAQSPYTKMAK